MNCPGSHAAAASDSVGGSTTRLVCDVLLRNIWMRISAVHVDGARVVRDCVYMREFASERCAGHSRASKTQHTTAIADTGQTDKSGRSSTMFDDDDACVGVDRGYMGDEFPLYTDAGPFLGAFDACAPRAYGSEYVEAYSSCAAPCPTPIGAERMHIMRS